MKVAGIWLEQNRRAKGHDPTNALLWFVEPFAYKVGAVWRGVGAGRGGWEGKGGGGGVLPVEEGVGEVGQGVGDAHGRRLDNVDAVTAVVGEGGTDVKGARGVGGPGGACKGGFKSVAELAHGEDGVSVEVKGGAVEAVIGRDGWVGAPGKEMVQGELHGGKELVPEVNRELDMNGGERSNDVVFGGTNGALGEVGAVVVGGDELDSGGWRARTEEGAHVGGRFVVREKVSDGVAGLGEETEDGLERLDVS